MGGASSKAARSLPKSRSSAVSSATGSSGGGGSTASRPTPPPPRTTAPPHDKISSQTPLQTADNIGQAGRTAGGWHSHDDGSVGPQVERSEGGSETKDDRIRRDAFDPDFVSQLNNLGPVNVPPAPWQSPNASRPNSGMSTKNAPSQPTPQRPSTRSSPSQMQRILQARQERENAQQQNDISNENATPGTDAHHLDAPTLTSLLDELKAAKTQGDIERISHSYDFDMKTLSNLTRRFTSPSIGDPVDPEEARYEMERDSDKPPRMFAVWAESSVPVKSADQVQK